MVAATSQQDAETFDALGERQPAEPTRQQEEARLGALTEQRPAALWTTDLELRFTSSTGAGLAGLGLRPNQVVGRSLYELFGTDDPDCPAIAATRRAVAGDSATYEQEWQGLVYQTHLEPLLDASGQVIGSIGVALDITDRKRAELLEKDRNHLLQLVVRNEPLQDVLTELVQMVERQHPEMLCSVLLLRDGRLYHGAAPSLSESYSQAIDGLAIGPMVGSCGTAAHRREAVIVSDIATDPRWEPYRDLGLRHNLRACWSFPILSGAGDVLGTFAIYYREPREPGRSELELLEMASKLAAIAIEHHRLVAAIERRASEAMAVAQVGRAIAGSLDLQAILDLIVEQACCLVGTSRGALAVLEPRGGSTVTRFVAERGLSDHFAERMRPRHWRDGTTPTAIAERRPVWSADLLDDPSFDLTPPTRAAIEAEGYRAVLSVPFLTGDRVLGALVVYRDEVGPFSSEEVDLLQVFADQAAIAVEHARTFQREQERRHQLDTLRRLTSTLVNTIDVGELAQRIVDAIPEAFGPESRVIAGLISTIDRPRHRIRAHAMTAFPLADRILAMLGRPLDQIENRFDPPKNLQHEVALSGEPRDGDHLAEFVVPTLPSAVAERIERLIGMRGAVAQPIKVHGQAVGVFLFALTRPVGTVTKVERALMADFASTAGIALENVRLYAAAERLTLTDPLTEVANRRRFDRALVEETARAARRGEPLALLLVDIDRFKAYNDAHGHQAGDEALRAVADGLRRSVRSTDLVARYGGEEFAILLPDTDTVGAHAVAEKARRALAEAWPPGLTISIGGAVRPANGAASITTAEVALVAAADAALYAAKRAGRNRTVVV